jgi:biopolymer transport protein ExbB/TolQ
LEFLAILLILGTLILLLLVIAIYQIKMAGMQVKDFWTFIKANDTLDKLYAFTEKYERLSPKQQVLFLSEAEKVFDAFDKVPNALWEEEYSKYMKILNKYKDIKILRWQESASSK